MALWGKAELQTGGPSGQAGLNADKGGFPRDLQPHPCFLLGTMGVSTAQEHRSVISAWKLGAAV